MSLKLKVGRGFRSASVGDRDSTSPSIRAQPITSRTTVSPSDTNSSKASGQQKKESDQGGCQYNNFIYSCGCVISGPGNRVEHVNCHGVPLGKIRCDNMRLNPSYPTIDSKCRNCVQDDILMKEARQNSPKPQPTAGKVVNLSKDVTGLFPIMKKHIHYDLTENLAKLGVNKELDTSMVSGEFKPAINKQAVAVSMKHAQAAARFLSPLDENTVGGETPKFSFAKPAGSPRSVTTHKTLAERHHDADNLRKARLLEEVESVRNQRERFGSHLAEARVRDKPDQLKLHEAFMAELSKREDILETKLALLEKPQLAWHAQEKIIESSAEARAIMDSEAEKEAAPFLHIVSGPSTLSAKSSADRKVEEKKESESSSKETPILKEVSEEGWDLVDEFEDHDWVDVHSPKIVRKIRC